MQLVLPLCPVDTFVLLLLNSLVKIAKRGGAEPLTGSDPFLPDVPFYEISVNASGTADYRRLRKLTASYLYTSERNMIQT